MRFVLFLFFCLLLFHRCSVKPAAYLSTSVPSAPDYSKSDYWAALPGKNDPADRTPSPLYEDLQASARADVFFLHPTTFTKKSKAWNASLGDAVLNKKTDETTILHQASIFNGAGRVFAPRYRQAHFQSFFTKDKVSADSALELAYTDIKNAFAYYLENYNNGRPVIIAAHSQGARHGIRLMKEFFDGKPLQKQLVVAYLAGWPVPLNAFEKIPPCLAPEQTGCVCSWRSYKHGYTPKKARTGSDILVVNPLTWTVEDSPAPKSLNEGTVLREFGKLYPGIADATIHEGILWVHKPRFPGSFLFRMSNYHIADFNFFYVNVRKNAQARVLAMLQNRG